MKSTTLNRALVAAALCVVTVPNLAPASAADVEVTTVALVIPGSAADVWKMIDTKLADIRAVIAGGQEVYLRDAKDPQDYLNFKQAIHDTKDLILALPTLMDGKDPDRDIVVVDANAAARRVDKLIQAIDDPKDHNPRFALTKLEEALATLRAHYPKGT